MMRLRAILLVLNSLVEQVIASGTMHGDKALMLELLFDCEIVFSCKFCMKHVTI